MVKHLVSALVGTILTIFLSNTALIKGLTSVSSYVVASFSLGSTIDSKTLAFIFVSGLSAAIVSGYLHKQKTGLDKLKRWRF